MSDPQNSSASILEERLRLGAGFTLEDQGHVLEILSPLSRHLAHWSPEQVDLELSLKNRGGPEQKVTLEAWLPRWPPLVATSVDRELDRALMEVRREMIREIQDQKAKHDPKDRPWRRGST